MNQTPDGIILRESRVISTNKIITLLIVLIVVPLLLLAGWYGWQMNQKPVLPSLESYGLTAEVPLNTNLYGQLYFSAAQLESENENLVPNIYVYDFSTKNSRKILEVPAHSFAPGNEEYDTAIVYFASSTDPDGYQPAWINKNDGTLGMLNGADGYEEVDLVISPDNKFYAYAYRTTPEGDMNSIDDWNIAIHNYETQDVITINKAAEPKFISGSSAVVYMTTEGISQYTLTNMEQKVIFDTYSNLTMQDDFDISKDATKMVLTLQRLNLISIIEMSDESKNYQEIGLIREKIARFMQPVISPNNRFYVVMAALVDNYSADTQSYSKINAELRAWESSAVINEVSFEGLYPESVTLEAWKN